MKVVKQAAVFAAILGAGALAALAAVAQTPPPGAPVTAPLMPALLPADAQRDAIGAWLTQNIPASRGHQVYVNGGEAFWIEHQDVNAKDDMKITATIHAENISDADVSWRSSYQVTQFDCERQRQFRVYLTKYLGNGLTGEVKTDNSLIKVSDFIPPTSEDFAHIRAVCLPAYDRIRKRTFTVTVPAQ